MKETEKHQLQTETPNKRKRVAIYARVNNGAKANDSGLSAQILQCRTVIEQHKDWELADTYADSGYSGLTAERPAFKRLMFHCSAGQYDMVLTLSASRLSRKTILLLNTLRELKKTQVDVHFIKENLYAFSPNGKRLLQISAALAVPDPYKEEVNADYSDQSSEGSDAAEA